MRELNNLFRKARTNNRKGTRGRHTQYIATGKYTKCIKNEANPTKL